MKHCLGYLLTMSAVAMFAAARGVEPLATRHLANAVRVTDKVLSGAQPEGEAAFAELEALGVKTIVSVDGTRPDVELAKKHGIRYVHLPHGYDGIPGERVRELAKAVRDLPSVIYVHCHHGKHRGPAAAAAGCLTVGSIDRADALKLLKLAGTSPDYRGLYRAVESAQAVPAAELDTVKVEFRSTAAVAPLAESMVAVDHAYDSLQALAKNGWQPLGDKPDLDPAHEALLLKEQFGELLRSPDARSRPTEFRALAKRGEQAAENLEASLRNLATTRSNREAALAAVTVNCKACHAKFRDNASGD